MTQKDITGSFDRAPWPRYGDIQKAQLDKAQTAWEAYKVELQAEVANPDGGIKLQCSVIESIRWADHRREERLEILKCSRLSPANRRIICDMADVGTPLGDIAKTTGHTLQTVQRAVSNRDLFEGD